MVLEDLENIHVGNTPSVDVNVRFMSEIASRRQAIGADWNVIFPAALLQSGILGTHTLRGKGIEGSVTYTLGVNIGQTKVLFKKPGIIYNNRFFVDINPQTEENLQVTAQYRDKSKVFEARALKDANGLHHELAISELESKFPNDFGLTYRIALGPETIRRLTFEPPFLF